MSMKTISNIKGIFDINIIADTNLIQYLDWLYLLSLKETDGLSEKSLLK